MTRRPDFVATAGLLVFGALAAGFAGAAGDSLRAVAALVAVLALPAFLLDRRLGHHVAGLLPAVLRVPLALVSWLSILALWSSAFMLLHAPFHLYATATTWLLLILYAGAALAPVITRGGPASPAIPRAVWIATAACAFFAAVIPHAMTVGDDSLDHIGYVRHILSEDSMRPAGVLAMPAGAATETVRPDPRKGALHPVIAFASVISATEPIQLWRWLSTLMFPATLLALYAFNAAFLRSRAARATAAVLIVLSFHGTAFRFAASSAHGESLAALWCWVMAAAVVSGARERVHAWLWLLLATGGVLVHLGVTAHVLVIAGTVACLGGAWGMARGERLRTGAAMLSGAALGAVLRWRDLSGPVNPLHAHTQGVLFVAKQWFVASPMEILRLDGMLFLGGLVCIPFLALVAYSRRDTRAVLAAAAIPFAVCFVPWIATPLFHRGSYMVFRSLLNVPAYAAIIVCVLWLRASFRSRRRMALLVGVPAAALWLVVFARPVPRSLAVAWRAQTGTRPPAEVLQAPLQREMADLPAGSVILSDPATSYALSAVSSHRFVAVYQQHANPRDPFALERLKAVRDVLSPYVMPDVALAACRRFGVNYVVINGSPPDDASHFMPLWSPSRYPLALARMAAMGHAFTLVDSAAGACIYRVEPAGSAGWAWSAQDQPVRVGAPLLSPCAVAAPDDDFTITGISVRPDRALPGDTVQVTIGYRHDAPSLFGLPVLMHIRFDHESLVRAREYPGDKIWRRLRDGRSGARSRFRADFVPGHGAYEPDLWPSGFDLCETFLVVIPVNARQGRYDVGVSVAYDALVPNFHLRDLVYNRDHYAGKVCGSMTVAGRVTGGGAGS